MTYRKPSNDGDMEIYPAIQWENTVADRLGDQDMVIEWNLTNVMGSVHVFVSCLRDGGDPKLQQLGVNHPTRQK